MVFALSVLTVAVLVVALPLAALWATQRYAFAAEQSRGEHFGAPCLAAHALASLRFHVQRRRRVHPLPRPLVQKQLAIAR